MFGFGSDPIDLQFATSLIFTKCSICNLTFCPTSGLFGNFQTLGIISRINLFGPRGFVCFVLEPPIQLIRLNFSTCQTELDTFQNQLPPCTRSEPNSSPDDDDDHDAEGDVDLLLLLLTCVLFPELELVAKLVQDFYKSWRARGAEPVAATRYVNIPLSTPKVLPGENQR